MHNIGILSVLFIALAVVVCLRVKEFVAMPLSISKQSRESFASTPVADGKIETSTDRERVNLSLVSNDKVWGIWMNQNPHRKIQKMIEAGLLAGGFPVNTTTTNTPTTRHTTIAVDSTIKLPMNSSLPTMKDLRLFEGPVSVRAGAGGGGGGGGGGEAFSVARPGGKELTVKIPMVKKNKYGQWVFDPWAATFGVMFLDTRFAARAAHTLPRVVVDSNPIIEYFPRKKKLEEICANKSTIYEGDLVNYWLMRHLSKTKFKFRPFQMGLRRTVYETGYSELCHSDLYQELTDYLLCQIIRNQRMESVLPKYSLQQIAIS